MYWPYRGLGLTQLTKTAYELARPLKFEPFELHIMPNTPLANYPSIPFLARRPETISESVTGEYSTSENPLR